MGATPRFLDMTSTDITKHGLSAVDALGRLKEHQGGRPRTSKSDKAIRARIRRARGVTEADLQQLYQKPIEEWDEEELARGRPRAKDGTFKGRRPKYIDAALHEKIVERFQHVVKADMNGQAVKALKVLSDILDDDRTDERGKPIVAGGTKLDAAKFLIEHVIGKPKQRVETDISVKLQGLLGAVMVNPGETNSGDGMALTQGFLDADSWEDDDENS